MGINTELFVNGKEIENGKSQIKLIENEYVEGLFEQTIVLIPHKGTKYKKIYTVHLEVTPDPTVELIEKKFQPNGKFTEQEIIKNIKSLPKGYQLFKIENITDPTVAKRNQKEINFLTKGSFKADLIFKHAKNNKEQKLTADFVIHPMDIPVFEMGKLSRKFEVKIVFSKMDISKNIPSIANGYVLKEIQEIFDNDEFSKKENETIVFNGVGKAKIKVLLEHSYKDNVVKEVALNVVKRNAEKLTITPFQKQYQNGEVFTENEILQKVSGAKSGYILKQVRKINPAKTLEFKNQQLKILGVGSVSAEVILEHPFKEDAICKNVQFVIKKGNAGVITFEPFTKSYSDGIEFSEKEIFNRIAGEKEGYSLKSLSNPSNSTIVKIQGKTLKILKVGTVEIESVLEHPFREEIRQNFKFKINKANAENLNDNGRFVEVYKNGGMFFTTNEILRYTTGNKTGYTVKQIQSISDDTVIKMINSKTELEVLKPGKVDVSVLFQHPFKADVLVTYDIEVKRQPAESLAFKSQLIQKYVKDGGFSQSEIISHLTGGDVSGYAITKVPYISEITVGKGHNNEILFLKAGTFRAKVLLEHPYKEKILVEGDFKIEKGDRPLDLDYKKQIEVLYSLDKQVVSKDIIEQMQFNYKGFSVKAVLNIDSTNPKDKIVPPNKVAYEKETNFLVDIVLHSDFYDDISIPKLHIFVKIKQKTIQDKDDKYSINDAFCIDSGGYILVGQVLRAGVKLPYVGKYDKDGGLIWVRYDIPSESSSVGMGYTQILGKNKGGYILSGYEERTEASGKTYQKIFFVELDDNGTLFTKSSLTGTYNQISRVLLQRTNGEFVSMFRDENKDGDPGYQFVKFKDDLVLGTPFNHRYQKNVTIYDLKEIKTGGFVAVGSVKEKNIEEGFVVKYDENFRELWRKKGLEIYPSKNGSIFKTVITDDIGNIYIGGHKINSNTKTQAIIVKLNQAGVYQKSDELTKDITKDTNVSDIVLSENNIVISLYDVVPKNDSKIVLCVYDKNTLNLEQHIFQKVEASKKQ